MPLVLLPGLACDAELFRDQLAPLASRVPVHVADVRRSADSIAAMAALLLAEHPGPLRLAGVSMGGLVALEAFAQAPARVVELSACGHLLTWERPAEVTAVLLDWMGSGCTPAGPCLPGGGAMPSTRPNDADLA